LAKQKRELLNEMADEKVLEQKAMELKLFKDQNEINDEIKKMIDTQYKAGKSEEDYNKWMTENKLTPEILNEIAKYQVVGQKIYDYVTKDVTVSDDEAKKYYDSNQLSFTEKPDTMEVSHILVAADKGDLAKEIKSKLDAGADFKALSDQYSTDEVAKANGGSLGEIQYFDPNYDSIFMTAAIALKEGQISNPVQTQFGWHIIKVTKKNEYPVKSFDQVKADIKDQLLVQDKSTKYNDSLTEWRTAAGIKIYDENIDNVK
jgi:foldase protein PrsA